MSIILFFIILLILVIVHEFGHFIVAKKFGIRVDEFGFGFPPRAMKLFKRGETLFTLNWLPIGGFVKIFGENPDDENTNGPDKARSFVNKPKRIQAAVLFAGVTFNFLLAWLLMSAGFMSGLPTSVGSEPKGAVLKDTSLVVVNVLKNSPAEIAGLKSGDKIISLSSGSVSVNELNPEILKDFVQSHPDKNIELNINHAGIAKSVTVVPKASTTGGKAAIGVALDMIGTLKLPIHKALWDGLKMTSILTVKTAVSLGSLVKDAVIGKADFSQVTGPVGIVGVVGDAYRFGWSYLISFMALISINLTVINLIPFPALDGGRLLFLLIEKIKGSPIKPKIANAVNLIGFGLLILLMVVVTYHDIVKLF